MKLSDYIFKYLSECGVKEVFYLPGGGAMHLVDSLGKCKDIRPIVCLHEQAAAIAAESVGQLGGIGVALVTSGPGATNAITGVAGAWTDSTPMLVISGQVKSQDLKSQHQRQNGIQELDIISLVKNITKEAIQIKDPRAIGEVLERLVIAMFNGRKGPVWLDIPLNMQCAEINDDDLFPICETPIRQPIINSNDALSIKNSLLQAKRPVIIIGNGIREQGQLERFYSFIDHTKIPVLTTWRTIDLFDESDRRCVGRPGLITSEVAIKILEETDLVLSLGARLDFGTVGYEREKFAPNAIKLVVDIDNEELRKFDNIQTYHTFHGSISSFFDAIFTVEPTKSREYPDISNWFNRCVGYKNDYPVIKKEYSKDVRIVNPYNFVDVLSGEMNDDDILVVGSSGLCVEITLQSFKVKFGQRVYNTPGLGSMGFGLPAAIGAAVHSGKRVVSIVGDGGLQHNIQELQTMQYLGLPVKLFVMNNGGYGSIQNMQDIRFNGHRVGSSISTGLSLPNLKDIANAYGLDYVALFNHTDLGNKLPHVLGHIDPVVCEVFVDPSVKPTPRMKA